MSRFVIERSREVGLSADRLWAVVGDPGGYHRFVPGLRSTDVVSGEGPGAVRVCEDTRGRTWRETCSSWEAGSSYTMVVDVGTYPPSFRMLLAEMAGTWSVVPTPAGSRLTLRFEGRSRWGPIGRMVVRALGDASSLDRILDRYEAVASGDE